MRVYELAKQVGCSSREIIDFLSAAGFAVQSHMSVVDDRGIELILEKFSPSAKDAGLVPADSSVADTVDSKVAQADAKLPPSGVLIPREPIVLGELAEKIKIPVGDIILFLLKKGQPFNKNQKIPENLLMELGRAFEFRVEEKSSASAKQARVLQNAPAMIEGFELRPPVVVIIGHVDHGKTTLLDYIRKSRVAEREKGGITQHLGAYEVDTRHGKLIFLDTPGHEAFTLIRKRGLGVADIAILVVAADDGIMPQTIEAINQAKAAGITIIVAINKIDKVDPIRVEVVRKMLSQYGLVPEEWGGDTIFSPISAKLGTNVDSFLELIALQAEMMELKSNPNVPAEGFVLESQMQKGFGFVATFLARRGLLKIGDYFASGDVFGRVVSIVDSRGHKLTQVGPSVPARLSGFDAMPKAGDYLHVISASEYKKLKAEKEKNRVFVTPNSSEAKIKLIIKADAESSREAVVGAIEKLSKASGDDVAVIFSSVGDLTESDVLMARNVGARIYCFNIKVDNNALDLSKASSVDVRNFNIIYKLLENLELLIESSKVVQAKMVKTGEAVVKKVFEIKKVGVVAGFGVKQGKIYKSGEIEIYRGNKKVGQGSIKSLQKDKKTVKEVGVGFEGAILVDGFDSWMEDDKIVCLMDSTLI